MKTKKINLLIPMSGQGVRYQKAGYKQPKPLIPVSGKPMIERLLENFPSEWNTYFVLAANHKNSALPELLKTLRPNSHIIFVDEHTLGPGHAIRAVISSLPKDEPVFVSYCDYAMVWDPRQFERFVESSECDACVISYRGFHAHYLSPVTYAYSLLENDRVVKIKEKGSFTNERENEFASSGGYYFSSSTLLSAAIEFQFQNDLQLNGEFYTSLTVDALLQMKKDANVRVFEIPGFFQWGTPQDLKDFEYWEKCFRSKNKFSGAKLQVASILMPMAGAGSRFSNITDNPKPFICFDGRPMFEHALMSLPTPNQTHLVVLKDHCRFSEIFLKKLTRTSVSYLEETPKGQALSTEVGCLKIPPEGDLVVSSCDHEIVLNPVTWRAFRGSPDCDAAIFTVNGFPGARRNPNAFAYVVPKIPSNPIFPLIQNVSVKKPVSSAPENDAVLVGTFWFKNKAILAKGIELLKEKNLQVNGELYLDSIFMLLIEKGYLVRLIQLDGYICWGDPDALAESLYWQEQFSGRRVEKRLRFPGELNARI